MVCNFLLRFSTTPVTSKCADTGGPSATLPAMVCAFYPMLMGLGGLLEME